MRAAPDAILKTSHLLGIERLSVDEIDGLLDLAETYVALNRAAEKKNALLKGRTLINLFFEASTRTQSSFELAGKRLGADVLNMSVKNFVRLQGRDADRHGDDAERHAARTFWSCAIRIRARPNCSRASSIAASSMRATAATNIRHRRCSMR